MTDSHRIRPAPGGEPLLTAERLLASSRQKPWPYPTLCSRRLPRTSPRVNVRPMFDPSDLVKNSAGVSNITRHSWEPPANTRWPLANARFQRRDFNSARSKAAPLQSGGRAHIPICNLSSVICHSQQCYDASFGIFRPRLISLVVHQTPLKLWNVIRLPGKNRFPFPALGRNEIALGRIGRR
jgi:hypothetical protein